MATPKSTLKIFVHSVGAVGHINSCVGLGQALVNRGHRIYYLVDDTLGGQFVQYGFDEILLYDQPKKTEEVDHNNNNNNNDNSSVESNGNEIKELSDILLKSGILSNKTPLQITKESNQSIFFERLFQKSVAFNDQIKVAIEREQPDLIVVDTFFVEPCIIHCGIPWIRLHSANPIMLYNSRKLPPISSGFSVYSDPEEWKEFQKASDEKYRVRFGEKQNKLLEFFGYPPVKFETMKFESPYLNVYGYPEELDYHDLVPRPDNFVRVDAFCRTIPGKFELPQQFLKQIKPGNKLVYVSLGSMGSINIELMKRLVKILAKTPHNYIVSKGLRHREYELGDNMWGEEHLPQTSILPFGKPMIVMPMFADQFDNAQRVYDKGFGVRLNMHEYTEQELIDSIDRLLNDVGLNQRLREISQRIQHSNSKEKACIAIEQMVEQQKIRN